MYPILQTFFVLKAGGKGDDREWDGWMASLTQWTEFEQTPGDSEEQGSLVCCSTWSCKESDTTEQLSNWTTEQQQPMLVPRVRPGTFSDIYLLSEEKEHMVSYLGTSPSDLKVTRFPVSALHSLISRSHGFLSGNFTLSSQGHLVSYLGTSPSDLKVTWFPIWFHSLILRSHGFLSGNFTLWSQGQRTEHHPWGRAGRCSSLGRGNLRSWTNLPREASTLPETPFMSFLMLPS